MSSTNFEIRQKNGWLKNPVIPVVPRYPSLSLFLDSCVLCAIRLSKFPKIFPDSYGWPWNTRKHWVSSYPGKQLSKLGLKSRIAAPAAAIQLSGFLPPKGGCVTADSGQRTPKGVAVKLTCRSLAE